MGGDDNGSVSRRGFFRRFMKETVSLADEVRGKPQMRLDDLDGLPDDELRAVVPVLSPAGRWRVEEGRVLARFGPGGDFIEVCRLDDVAAVMLDAMDGARTVEEVAWQVVDRVGASWSDAWPGVRERFLTLARRGVCRPRGSGLAG